MVRAIPYQDPQQEAARLKAVHEARVKIVPQGLSRVGEPIAAPGPLTARTACPEFSEASSDQAHGQARTLCRRDPLTRARVRKPIRRRIAPSR